MRTIPRATSISPPEIPEFLGEIINKKMGKVKLSTLEALIDFLCNCLYNSYNEYYQFRFAQRNILPIAPREMPIAQAVHRLKDEIPLIDRTHEQIVSVERDITTTLVHHAEKFYITLDGRRLLLFGDPNRHFEFCRATNTQQLIIQDHPRMPHIVQVIEYKKEPGEAPIYRYVDLRKIYRLTEKIGLLRVTTTERDVYVIEDQITEIQQHPHGKAMLTLRNISLQTSS